MMNPDQNSPRHRRDRPALETVAQRLTAVEREHRRLENTLRGFARETGVAVAGPCPRCERAYMLGKDGVLRCPTCRNRHAI